MLPGVGDSPVASLAVLSSPSRGWDPAEQSPFPPPPPSPALGPLPACLSPIRLLLHPSGGSPGSHHHPVLICPAGHCHCRDRRGHSQPDGPKATISSRLMWCQCSCWALSPQPLSAARGAQSSLGPRPQQQPGPWLRTLLEGAWGMEYPPPRWALLLSPPPPSPSLCGGTGPPCPSSPSVLNPLFFPHRL